jgi:solute carrier family 25, member 34/35
MASLSTLGGFTAGALAACGAVTVTNPMEVVKTRLQLQGELAARGQVKKIYTGVFQALRVIAINEGIRGIIRNLKNGLIPGTQRGLGVAVCLEFAITNI